MFPLSAHARRPKKRAAIVRWSQRGRRPGAFRVRNVYRRWAAGPNVHLVTLVAMSLLLGAWQHAAAETPLEQLAVERLDEDQQLELEHLLESLRDENLELERRRRAAQILLLRDWPVATHALKLDLLRTGEVGTRRAVAQAIAAVDLPDEQLIEPLMNLLGAEEEPLRRDVAAALGRFSDAEVVDRLMAIARQGGESQEERLGAIAALAQHRQREVVELLLELVEPGDWTVRSAAFDALARLSGVHTLGNDAEAWRQWWRRAEQLEPEQWHGSLLQNFSNRKAELARQLEVTAERLVSAHNRLYDAAAESSRPGMLEQMLNDPMEELRLLALRLIERRVLNAQPVGPEVRQGMRQLLDDPRAAVRIKSAMVLETLADAEAAELATDLLLAERSREVQAAYLALMGRVPRQEAVEPALWLLRQERAQASAADCLRAAFDEGLMSERQIERARDVVRRHFEERETAERAMLRLLSRIGQEQDLEVLVTHLRHEDGSLRTAAARGFRQSQWPLEPLMEVLGESDLAPLVIEVAERRGQEVATVEHLLEHEPDSDNGDLGEAWGQALEAIAGRLDQSAVVELDDRITAMERDGLHERLLLAAADLDDGDWESNGTGRRAEAALRLGRLYVQREQFAEAEAVYEGLASRRGALTEEHRRRLPLERTRTMLRAGAVEEAAELNAALLEEDASEASAEELAAVWIEQVERGLNSGGEQAVSSARTVIEAAETLFTDHADEALRIRLAELRERLDELTAA